MTLFGGTLGCGRRVTGSNPGILPSIIHKELNLGRKNGSSIYMYCMYYMGTNKKCASDPFLAQGQKYESHDSLPPPGEVPRPAVSGHIYQFQHHPYQRPGQQHHHHHPSCGEAVVPVWAGYPS